MDKMYSWKNELREALKTGDDLYRAGFISESQKTLLDPVLKKYSFLLPRYYANLIDKNNPDCPIRLQAIPHLSELNEDNSLEDPLSDLNHQPVTNITHRYSNRVLLHLTSNCSMYCRFCFRKTLLNDLSSEMFDANTEKAVDYISRNTQINEVIFSGGDPFLANEVLLKQVLKKLSSIEHIERIRFHTRVPVTLPMRIDDEFLEILESSKSLVVVTHFNHSKEVTEESSFACDRIRKKNVLLLNQSVLLKGVNDSVEELEKLYKRLFSISVLPYYLHHPDKSKGTSHFDVSLDVGKKVMHHLRLRLPGYMVPKYVRDNGEGTYKELLG